MAETRIEASISSTSKIHQQPSIYKVNTLSNLKKTQNKLEFIYLNIIYLRLISRFCIRNKYRWWNTSNFLENFRKCGVRRIAAKFSKMAYFIILIDGIFINLSANILNTELINVLIKTLISKRIDEFGHISLIGFELTCHCGQTHLRTEKGFRFFKFL